MARDVPIIAGVGLGTSTLIATIRALQKWGWGWDSRAYYEAARHLDYTRLANFRLAYLYSPVFAQVLRPLTILPWPVFAALWSLVALLTLNFLLRGVRWPARATLLYLSSWEVAGGNVHWAIAAATAFGIASPVWWALPTLTKVAPGVGALWFVARREWRRFGVAVIATTLPALVSFVLAPESWAQWVHVVTQSMAVAGSLSPSLPWAPIRLLLAAMLVLVAARRSKVWLVPVAVCLAMPNWALPAMTVLYAIPRLIAVPGDRSDSHAFPASPTGHDAADNTPPVESSGT